MPGLLVADDEAIVRSAVAAIITRGAPEAGPIGEAGSGEEAISLARQMRPSIVLMDVKMPGLNGLEATRKIRSEYPKTRVIMLTAYDEFSYSQEALRLGAVDYLLKPIRPAALLEVIGRVQSQIQQEEKHQIETEQVSNRLRDTLPLVEARLVHDLVHGAVGAKTAQDRIITHLGKTLEWPAVLVVDIDRFRQTVQSMQAEKFDRFCNLLLDIVRRVVPDDEHTLIGQIRPGIIVAILSAHKQFGEANEVRALAHTIRYAIEASAPVTATVGIGQRYPDLEMIPLSYSEALRARWFKLYFGRNSVIHFNDIQSLSSTTRSYPLELEQELVAAIRLGQRQESDDLMQMIVESLLQNLPNPPEMILTRFMELVVLVSRAVINAGAPSPEVLELSHEKVAALEGLRTRSELRAWVVNSLTELMAKIPGGDRGSRLVERAIAFMQEKLGQAGLELKDVASAVHVSPSHLAHLFKEKTGMSYVKYLTSLRLEEAKKLLATTDLTITQIAEEVGYGESTYFHRVFRRELAMTPAAYRQIALSSS